MARETARAAAGGPLVVVLGPTDVRVLVAGLRLLEARCRTDRVPIPAAVKATLDALSRHHPTTSDTTASLADTSTVPPTVLLVDLDHAARTLAVSRRTIERLAATGELRTVRVGRSRRIHVDDLAGYAEHLTQESA